MHHTHMYCYNQEATNTKDDWHVWDGCLLVGMQQGQLRCRNMHVQTQKIKFKIS